MRVKVKNFDELTCRHQTIGNFDVDPTSTISSLKEKISSYISLQDSCFHLEAYVLNIKVFLTESFQFDFFFTGDFWVIFLEVHYVANRFSVGALFEKALKYVSDGDTKNLKSLLAVSLPIQEDLLSRRHTNDWSLLHFASFFGFEEVLTLLLRFSVNCNEESHDL